MIPMELITMIGSTLVGGILKLWGMSSQAKHQREMDTIKALSQQGELWDKARSVKNSHFQWTRRIIALAATGAIIVWPLVVPVVSPGTLVTHGWTEWNPGFWFFTQGKEVMEWKSVTGLVITPLHTHLMAAISGLYFGSSIAGHK